MVPEMKISLSAVIPHSIVCLVTGPWPLPKLVLHRMWSSVSCFSFQCLQQFS